MEWAAEPAEREERGLGAHAQPPQPPHFCRYRKKNKNWNRQSITVLPNQKFGPSAVPRLSMKAKKKGCGGQMDMKKHRKHELRKT